MSGSNRHLGIKAPSGAKLPASADQGMKNQYFKIDQLEAANRELISVHPTSALKAAVTKMVINDFSQLPVMSSERKLNGFISWKTIGVTALFGVKNKLVKDHMDKNPPVIRGTDNLLEAVSYILDKDFAFVKDSAERVSGIVTLFDIAQQFKILSEPFIILQHIETSIRNFIEANLDQDRLTAVYAKIKSLEPTGSRMPNSTKDLTFGNYLTIIGDEFWWDRFQIDLDRKAFIEKLDRVRKIRNEVMHFRTSGLSQVDLKQLKDVSKFFRMLESVKGGK